MLYKSFHVLLQEVAWKLICPYMCISKIEHLKRLCKVFEYEFSALSHVSQSSVHRLPPVNHCHLLQEVWSYLRNESPDEPRLSSHSPRENRRLQESPAPSPRHMSTQYPSWWHDGQVDACRSTECAVKLQHVSLYRKWPVTHMTVS